MHEKSCVFAARDVCSVQSMGAMFATRWRIGSDERIHERSTIGNSTCR